MKEDITFFKDAAIRSKLRSLAPIATVMPFLPLRFVALQTAFEWKAGPKVSNSLTVPLQNKIDKHKKSQLNKLAGF